MEANFWLASLPAVIALLLKGGIYAYARYSRTHSFETRLYLLTLFAFSVQNLAEIGHFYTRIERGLIPSAEVTAFYAATILAFAFLFHLVLTLAFDRRHKLTRAAAGMIYSYALVLELLLLFTPWLISGYTPIGNHTVTRIPGPLYGALEIYGLGICLSMLGVLAYGTQRQESAHKRARAKIVLLSIVPIIVVVATVLVALHLGVRAFNAAIIMPMAITVFLAVSAYATHQYRLFDIDFYIPWSKVRKRKTAFYDRLRAIIAEIADLGSVADALDRVADTLRCPVALVGGPKPLLAAVGAHHFRPLAAEALRDFDQILVANEIAETQPAAHAIMKRNGIAAIVPFHPHSQNAASWLLLGDSFSEQVYTPRDFRAVEELFAKMADLFLDKLLAMRTQLADAHHQIHTLELRLETTEASLSSVRERVDVLAHENTRLLREQPADSLLAAADRAPVPFTITLLGRDKRMLAALRQRFPHTESYVGPDSASFKRQPPAAVLVVRLDTEATAPERRLLQLLTSSHSGCAALLCGPRAPGFISAHRRELAGCLLEALPPNATEETLARKVSALAELRRLTISVTDVDHPLIGQSVVFRTAMNEVRRLARLRDPIFVKTTDSEEALALARFIHEASGIEGRLAILRTTDAVPGDARPGAADIERIDVLIEEARGGTLMIDNIGALSNELWARLLLRSDRLSGIRLIAAGLSDALLDPEALLEPLKPLVLEMPSLRERRADIPALVHYFTLQFNLQAATERYLKQNEVDDLIASEFPRDLRSLKSASFLRLISRDETDITATDAEVDIHGKTLDECTTEFEARLIADTLKRCGGNKSKAARLLGLRPNTLHYKLERYGLLERKKNNN